MAIRERVRHFHDAVRRSRFGLCQTRRRLRALAGATTLVLRHLGGTRGEHRPAMSLKHKRAKMAAGVPLACYSLASTVASMTQHIHARLSKTVVGGVWGMRTLVIRVSYSKRSLLIDHRLNSQAPTRHFFRIFGLSGSRPCPLAANRRRLQAALPSSHSLCTSKRAHQ